MKSVMFDPIESWRCSIPPTNDPQVTEVTVRVCARCLCEINLEGCSYNCEWDFDANESDRRKGSVLVRKYRITKELISETRH